MKIFLKVLKISALVFIGLLITLIVAGWALQDRIIQMAIDKASETIGAPMEIEKVKFSLIKDFPEASLDFGNMWIGRELEDSKIDTLAKIDNLHVTLNVEDLMNNIFTVHRVEVSEGYIKYLVDTTGVSCYDFLLVSDSTTAEIDTVETSAPLDLSIDALTLKEIELIYSDDQLGAGVNVNIPELSATADLDSLKTLATTAGALTLSNIRYDDSNANRLNKAQLTFDVDYKSDSIKARSISLKTDELAYEMSGDIILGENIYTDINTSINIPNLASLMKFSSDEMLDTLGIGQVSGSFNIDTQIKGYVSEETIPHYETSFNLANASIKYAEYPTAYNINLKGNATNGSKNNNSTTSVNLKLFEVDCSGNHIQLAGKFSNLDKLSYSVQSSIDLNLAKSKSLIPDDPFKKLSGIVNAVVVTSGTLPTEINDAFIESAIRKTKIDLKFNGLNVAMDSVPEIRDLSANLRFKHNELSLKNFTVNVPEYQQRIVNTSAQVLFKGQYLKPEYLDIEIPKFYLSTTENILKGSVSVCDMKEVDFDLVTALNLDLEYLKQFASDTLVNDMNGKLLADIKSRGQIHLDSIEQQIQPILFDQSSFDIRMKNINTDMTDQMMNVKDLNGQVVFTNRLLQIKNFKGEYSEIKFKIDTTTVRNLVETVIENQADTLKVESITHLGHLDYDKLMAMIASPEGEANNKEPESSEPSEPQRWKMEAKGKFFIESVKYENALLEDITALYNLQDTIYTIDKLHFDGFGGDGIASLKVTLLKDEEMFLNMKGQVDNLDMARMARELPSIFEEYISHEQMSGLLTSEESYLQFSMKEIDGEYGPDLESMMMKSHIFFKDGGFYNYPAITEALKEMPSTKDKPDTLLFNTIDTYIFIFNNAINIPGTKIVTNKLNAKLVGEQSFGENYDYRVGINIKEVLFNNKKKQKIKEEQIDIDIDDVDLDKLKWLKSQGKDGKYKNVFITSEDFKRKEKLIRARRNFLKVKFHPNLFSFNTNVSY
ncbi:AsmA family protein [Reichenbachiella versicolor]|uniref:hypothetical protein n=1 Tax=Reichenbachiella versicolor TaxID=1821036 RepID=UPI000D6DCAFF|nr:hypothetical protein [Reichenbachiella versicolor]